jgi:predicted aldo/keto reductase-like oxidoreductase
MNKLGFGFLRLPKQGEEYDWDLLNQMVDIFMEHGGSYFDTCYTYLNGKSEEGIRKCVVERKERASFQLAEKLPGYQFKSYDDCQIYFEEELKRCGVTYFDVLMLHWLNDKNYAIAEKYDEFRFLREKKSEGLAKRIGFSYHGNAALLETILSTHPEVDLVLLQINYLDWESAGIESKKCYEVCVKHGKKVVVMEPVKGGTLASLPLEAEQLLRNMHPDWTPADWALRFVQSLPEVEICLSGMNTISQIEANIRPFDPLNEAEIALLMQVRTIIEQNTVIACTGCQYCVSHCPKHIQIPQCIKMYNEVMRYPNEDWKIIPSYTQLTLTTGKASECIGCRSCEKQCPQNIKISEYMKLIAEKFEQ